MVGTQLSTEWSKRPWWMNLMFGFCLFMTFAYMPFDMFLKPVAQDQEVWFGFLLEGWAAKATEPLHWAIYGSGALGFWKMKPWMWPWGAIYVLQVAISMLVWNVMQGSFGVGAVSFATFIIPAAALYRSRKCFRSH